jgi:hypothetical protein
VARLKAFLVNLATVAVTIGLMLIMAEVVLRFLPVATALPVEPPTDANPIQRYAANQPYTWSFDWNMHHVNRGRIRTAHARSAAEICDPAIKLRATTNAMRGFVASIQGRNVSQASAGCRVRWAIADAPMRSRSRVRR